MMEFFRTYQKQILIVMISIIIGGSIIGFIAKKILPDKDQKALKQAIPIKSITIKEENRSVSIPIMGTISFKDKATISSKILGRVEKLYVEQGNRVRRSQVLARIESRTLHLDLKSARADLKSARGELHLAYERLKAAERNIEKELKGLETSKIDTRDKYVTLKNMESTYRKQKQLNKVGGVSDSEIDSLKTRYVSTYSSYLTSKKNYEIKTIGFRNIDIKKAGYTIPNNSKEKKKILIKINTSMERAQVQNSKNTIDKLKTQIEKLQTTINESVIRSPISGIVAIRGVELGEMIKQDTNLYVIMNVAQVYFISSVNEKDSGSMIKGQKVNFTVDALDKANFKGRIHIVSPLLDKETRTLEVKIIANNYKGTLRPGMFARGIVEIKTIKNMIAIPHKAVQQSNGRHYVYIIRNNTAYKKEITIGPSYGTIYHHLKGLKKGDIIAASEIRILYDGSPVKIIKGNEKKK